MHCTSSKFTASTTRCVTVQTLHCRVQPDIDARQPALRPFRRSETTQEAGHDGGLEDVSRGRDAVVNTTLNLGGNPVSEHVHHAEHDSDWYCRRKQQPFSATTGCLKAAKVRRTHSLDVSRQDMVPIQVTKRCLVAIESPRCPKARR